MRLAEFCEVQSGLTLRTGVDREGTVGLQAGDFNERGQLAVAPNGRVSAEKAMPRHQLQHGDVLFRSRGAFNTAWAVTPEFVGAVAIMPLFRLRPSSQIVEAAYLAWVINQPAAQFQLAQGATSGTVRSVNKPVLLSLDIPMPPLRVQTAIAELAAEQERERDLALRLVDQRHQLLTSRLNSIAKSASNARFKDQND